jgi:hypothetical protein
LEKVVAPKLNHVVVYDTGSEEERAEERCQDYDSVSSPTTFASKYINK